MNKQELIAAVAAETSMPKKCVEAVIKIAASTVPAFKAGKAFKEAVNAKPAKKGKK